MLLACGSVVFVGVLLAFPAAGQSSREAGTPEVLLELGVRLQTVDGDIRAAIQIYQRLLSRPGSNRAVEAKALLRLGQCHEKLGEREAIRSYERLVKEYGDQAAEAMAAQTRLAALKQVQTAGSAGIALRRVAETAGAISADGRFFVYTEAASGSGTAPASGHRMLVRNLQTGQTQPLSVSFPRLMSTYGNYVVAPDGSSVIYRTLSNPQEVHRIAVGAAAQSTLVYRAEEDESLSLYQFLDGGRTVLVERTTRGTSSFCLLDVGGGRPQPTKSPGRPGVKGGAAVSPDGRFLAYGGLAPWQSGRHEIVVQDLGSGGEAVLAEGDGDNHVLGWAPDGSGLLYSSDRNGTTDAWFQPMNGKRASGRAVLIHKNLGAAGTASAYGLGMGRDGTLYYRMYVQHSGFELADMEPAKGQLGGTVLTSEELARGYASTAAWLPGGGQLVFPVSVAANQVLHFRSQAGETVRKLPLPNITRLLSFDIAQDGRSAVVSAVLSTGTSVLGLLNLENGALRVLKQFQGGNFSGRVQLVRSGGEVFYVSRSATGSGQLMRFEIASGQERIAAGGVLSFSLSPAETTMAFTVESPGGGRLMVRDLNSGVDREIASGVDGAVSWTPSGASLWYSKGGGKEIWGVDADGGEAKRVGTAGGGAYDFRIRPDGGQVLLLANQRKLEVWMMENWLPDAQRGRPTGR